MLYHVFQLSSGTFGEFSVFQVTLLRALIGLISGFVCSWYAGAWFIRQSGQFRSKVREYTPASHQAKNDTPTMGGIFVLGALFFNAFLLSDLMRPEVWIFLGCVLGFGAIGYWDDYMKIRFKKGIKEKHKLLAQVIVAVMVSLSWYFLVHPSTEVCIPFLSSWKIDLGLLLIPWAAYILIGASNAVNLTDGLDGLAVSSLWINYVTFGVICYVAGNAVYAQQLSIPYAQTTEISILGAILAGASLGFLWYNSYPAQVFMGDVGSLAFGAGLACMALMARQEILLALTGILFVVETVSVMLQVISLKVRKKRIFKMAPIHHHFELIGWPETHITNRFTILTLMCCSGALVILALR